MSDSIQRRRRSGASSARCPPSRIVATGAARPGRINTADLAACAAVAIVSLALVALVWIVTLRTEQEQHAEVLDRAEQALMGQASVIAETVGNELLLIDQSLTVLQTAWKVNSEAVELTKWQQQTPVLTAVADDLFISDEKHIIRQDILPQAIGQGVGAGG